MSKSIDLGFEVPDYRGECSPCSPKSEEDMPKKTVYPEFSIRDNDKLVKALKGKVGQEFTALVRLRCSMAQCREVEKMDGKDDYYGDNGYNADIQVLAITPQDISLPSGDEDDEESATEALDNFQKSKKSTS